MTFFPDLDPCTYFGPCDGRLLAVGWLEREQSFATGAVPPAFVAALTQLTATAWQPFAMAGSHACSLCPADRPTPPVTFGDVSIWPGMPNLFVPDTDCAYVAPSLIVHYVEAHAYAPPAVFQRALLACPPMGSAAYFQALKVHGVLRLGPFGADMEARWLGEHGLG